MGWGLRTSGCLQTHYVAEAVFEPLTFWIPLWSSGVSSTPLCSATLWHLHTCKSWPSGLFSFFHLPVLPLLLPLTKWFPCSSSLTYLNLESTYEQSCMQSHITSVQLSPSLLGKRFLLGACVFTLHSSKPCLHSVCYCVHTPMERLLHQLQSEMSNSCMQNAENRVMY